MEEFISNTKKELKALLSTLSKHYAFLSAATIFVFYFLCIVFSTLFLISFDIRLSLFSGLVGAMDIALANGYSMLMLANAGMIAGLIILIKTYLKTKGDRNLIFIEGQRKDSKLTFMDQLKNTSLLFAFLIFTTAFILLMFWTFFSSPHQIAKKIKAGFTERYTIQVNNNKKYKCVAPIAGMSEYLLIWDFVKKRTILIPKSSISELSVSVEIPPQFQPIPSKRIELEEEAQENLRKHRVTQLDWSNSLRKECNQNVEWPVA